MWWGIINVKEMIKRNLYSADKRRIMSEYIDYDASRS
jgi:hypothetical protein